jgi:hypothetical protein
MKAAAPHAWRALDEVLQAVRGLFAAMRNSIVEALVKTVNAFLRAFQTLLGFSECPAHSAEECHASCERAQPIFAAAGARYD